jgi:hypothetical protein
MSIPAAPRIKLYRVCGRTSIHPALTDTMGNTEKRQYATAINSQFDDKPKRRPRSPKPAAE